MSATAISDFREAVRLVIGDDDVEGIYEYEDEQIDAAVRLVFQMGKQPSDNQAYTLAEDGDTISPAIAWGDDFALVTLQAARLRFGGGEGGVTYRTRAFQVGRADRGEDKWNLMRELERQIYEKEGGTAFATQRDFARWLNDMSGGLLERSLSYTGRTFSIYAG